MTPGSSGRARWMIGFVVIGVFSLLLALDLETDLAVMTYLLTSTVLLFGGLDIALAIPTTIGYPDWITRRLLGVRVYADHYDDEPVPGRNHRYV